MSLLPPVMLAHDIPPHNEGGKAFLEQRDKLKFEHKKSTANGGAFLRFYVNSWGRGKIGKSVDRVGASAPARFYVLQNRIRFLKLLKLRIP